MKRIPIYAAVSFAILAGNASLASAGYTTPSGGYLSDEQLAIFDQRQSEPVSTNVLEVQRALDEIQMRESNQIAD
jgi:hypothetical protein